MGTVILVPLSSIQAPLKMHWPQHVLQKTRGIHMDCLICRDLEQKLETRRMEFANARGSASYGVSTKSAAYRNVDMEQARSELQDHRSVCAHVSRKPPVLASRAIQVSRRPVAA
jgi:hypothetical protein